jgi:hypothetical protein
MAKIPERAPPQTRWAQWIETVSLALTGNLSVKDNLAQCWVKVPVEAIDSRTIKTLTPIPLPLLRGRIPYGVSVERVEVSSGSLDWFPSVDWEPSSRDGTPALKIRTAYGFNPGTKATLTLLVKAE